MVLRVKNTMPVFISVSTSAHNSSFAKLPDLVQNRTSFLLTSFSVTEPRSVGSRNFAKPWALTAIFLMTRLQTTNFRIFGKSVKNGNKRKHIKKTKNLTSLHFLNMEFAMLDYLVLTYAMSNQAKVILIC